jgi:hypothetical protein
MMKKHKPLVDVFKEGIHFKIIMHTWKCNNICHLVTP